MNPIENLTLAESKGRRMPLAWKNPNTEAVEVFDRESVPCPGCGHVTTEGQVITKVFRVWWHHECAQAYLQQAGRDEAWRVLGRQLADRPSMFNATTTRAIVENLLRIAGGAV